jgi:hypothetical protein
MLMDKRDERSCDSEIGLVLHKKFKDFQAPYFRDHSEMREGVTAKAREALERLQATGIHSGEYASEILEGHFL